MSGRNLTKSDRGNLEEVSSVFHFLRNQTHLRVEGSILEQVI